MDSLSRFRKLKHPRKTFSLLTALLLVAMAALCVSQYSLMSENRRLRKQVHEIRAKYGYIKIENNLDVLIAQITDHEQDGVHAYRMHLPPGNHFLLHLSDIPMPDSSVPENPPTKQSISLNSWKDGADVVLKWSTTIENGNRRLVVTTETEELFDYSIKNWNNPSGFSEGSQLATNGQRAYSMDDTIQLMWSRNPDQKRGIVLWLEPAEAWNARTKK